MEKTNVKDHDVEKCVTEIQSMEECKSMFKLDFGFEPEYARIQNNKRIARCRYERNKGVLYSPSGEGPCKITNWRRNAHAKHYGCYCGKISNLRVL